MDARCRFNAAYGLLGGLAVLVVFLGGTGVSAEKSTKGRALNNLVTELLDVSPGRRAPKKGYTFTNPREGWVFFRSTGRVGKGEGAELALSGHGDDGKALRVINHTPGKPITLEAMRYLPKGEHRLVVTTKGRAKVSSLTVRAIPEIIYANFPSDPHLKEYGPYDHAFLKKIGMWDNVNVIITGGGGNADDFLKRWRAQGKRILQQVHVPGLSMSEMVTVDQAYTYWNSAAGLANEGFDGVIVDEFLPSAIMKYPIWVAAIKGVRAERPDRVFYPYIAGFPLGLRSFVRPLADTGCRFAYERYLREQRTESRARKYIERALKKDLLSLSKADRGLKGKTIFVLGVLSGPPETLNSDPSVSYKVYMDMQFHLLANDRALRGLYGIEEYLSSYADEEYLRWAAKLYRHYCIEGKKDRLTNDPYKLNHIANPDFEEALKGWQVSRGEAGSVAARKMAGYAWLQGRYPRDPQGDTFAWMRRSAAGPNAITQTIRNLEADRTYSLKMYVGDYKELTRRRKHKFSVKIDGAAIIPSRGVHAVFKNCYSHHIKKYGDKDTYFNWVRVVFRAKSGEARLTISDWVGEKQRGGPVGQELIFNFVEVEPFLMD